MGCRPALAAHWEACYNDRMNVLLTSAGRRTYLVRYFQEALRGEGLVFASNSAESPALFQADGAAITPLIYSEEYIPFLLSFCREHGIGLLVPLFDIDLPVLARNRAAFEKIGVKLAVSSEETLGWCNDKAAMCERLRELSVATPEVYLTAEAARESEALPVPYMIKPRFGMGSIAVRKACTREELTALYGMCEREIAASYLRYESAAYPGENVIIQRCVRGDEYGLDVINDLEGRYAATIVRRKLAMRAGETDEAVILGLGDDHYAALSALGRTLSEGFRHIGNMDVDVIVEQETQTPYVIDMNARFGGGYPFSHLAGVRLPDAYVAWAKGETPDPAWFKAKPHVHGYKDITICRYGTK